MSIEEEIFKRSKLNERKLLVYGFEKKNNEYFYSKTVLNNDFKVDVLIDANRTIKGKVIDLLYGEEYFGYRCENDLGEFANRVRTEFYKVLLDVRSNCYTREFFLFAQANRVAKYIYSTYKDTPDFPWEKSKGFGVFRNSKNNKWYALIMNLSGERFSKSSSEVEIINLKLDKSIILDLLKENGFYKAYHMNKENWISVILDDTVTDEKIYSLIDQSYEFARRACK